MKFITTLCLASVTLFSFAQQTNETIDVDGVNRTYVQYLPTGFDLGTESLPVVFCLHGIGDVATNMANIGFNQIADTARFIAIYPQGVANGQGQNSWANGTLFLSSTADDISFFNLMIDDLILNNNADPSRVYASGFSMGSIMSHKLACELNDRIAAIGTMSGTMSSQDLNNCVPTYATPIIHFHGTADATIPYDVGALPSLTLVPATLNFWRDAHGCVTTADSTQIPDVASDGYTVDRFIYQGCTPLSSVEFWRINGGDHEYFYQPFNDFTESIEIWRFFGQWSHSNPAQVGVSPIDQASFSVYPNPSSGQITISSPVIADISIHSVNGQLIQTIGVENGMTPFDLDLEEGVYILSSSDFPEYSQRIVIQ
ncbi:MAG: PHB depolymerase family esterase [Crocinitomicaceae bacterium]|nr:PHB depolymerase family esterase [Crocinitomicaceae bacterium]